MLGSNRRLCAGQVIGQVGQLTARGPVAYRTHPKGSYAFLEGSCSLCCKAREGNIFLYRSPLSIPNFLHCNITYRFILNALFVHAKTAALCSQIATDLSTDTSLTALRVKPVLPPRRQLVLLNLRPEEAITLWQGTIATSLRHVKIKRPPFGSLRGLSMVLANNTAGLPPPAQPFPPHKS